MNAVGRLRVACCAAALCMPTVVVLSMSAWFYSAYLPKLIKDEPARVANAANAVADELLAGERTPDLVWRRGAGVIRGREQHAALADEFPPDMTWSAWHPPIKYARTKEKRGSAARPEGLLVWVRDTAEGHDADTVLVCVGRRPYTEGLFAEGAQPETDRGRILTDRYGETTLPLADDVTFTDGWNIEKEPLTVRGADAVAEAINGTDMDYFSPLNTTVRVEGGKIVEIVRAYMP